MWYVVYPFLRKHMDIQHGHIAAQSIDKVAL